MTHMLSREDLERRVKELEAEAAERGRIEKALRESEGRYRSLFKNNHSVMLIIDPENGDIVDANPAALAYYGWSLKEITSKKITEINTLTKEQIFHEMENARSEERSHFIFRHRLSNGDIQDVEVFSGPINLHGKNLLYSIVHDITDRIQNEEALKKHEALLKDTGRMAKVGGWELDGETLEIDWTEEITNIYELPFGQKLPLEKAISFFHPDDRPRLESALQKALDYGEPYDMEIRLITANGRHLWTHTICKPVVVDGKTVKLTGTFQDITERKLIEEEREKLIEELQKALHEIKTLRGILPICSSCKKIRDDKGSWNQIESYVRDHSDAEFSHGICPECMKELYPRVYEKLPDKNK